MGEPAEVLPVLESLYGDDTCVPLAVLGEDGPEDPRQGMFVNGKCCYCAMWLSTVEASDPGVIHAPTSPLNPGASVVVLNV
jgi:hypothetical protein